MGMNIGKVQLNGKLMLAPMAGVTDKAFRAICREYGAAYTVTEMVSTRALSYQDKKTPKLLALSETEHPSAAQIFGHEPETMAEGAKIAREISGADIIDINMGCPAPKIAGNGDGAALMKDEKLAAGIIEAVKKAVDVPVTVKFRKGWDASSINCVSFAKLAENAGADMIAIHGRTRAEQYAGKADWQAIKVVKEAVKIPVAGNGDVFSPEDALRMIEQTKVDFVMIGRGALGDPFLFERTNALLETGVCPTERSFAEKMKVALRQMQMAAEQKGEYIAMLEARKHVNWYLKNQSGMKEYKKRICALETLAQLELLIAEMTGQS